LFPFIRGTELLCWIYRALGANIGKRVNIDIDTAFISDFDMIEIGDDTGQSMVVLFTGLQSIFKFWLGSSILGRI
jgi:hypothetical protein